MSYRPTAYMPLYVEQPAAIQRGLFATSIPEPPAEPPCEHPVTEQQRRLIDQNIIDDVCVVCGKVVDDEALP
jgi:hypothetical protein